MTKWSCDKTHAPDRGRLTTALLLALFAIYGCEHSRRPAPTDINDIPQHASRSELRAILGDLTAVPNAPEGWRTAEMIRAPIYSRSVDIVQLLATATCMDLRDTCDKQVRIFRWDTAKHSYEVRDNLAIRSAYNIQTEDLTGDGLDELLLETRHNSRSSGFSVLGVTSASHVLVSRYQRDTIRPTIVAIGAGRSAIVEYDSEYARLASGVSVNVPKKFLGVQGEFYLEQPADSNWSRYVDRVRDSVHLVLSLTRDEMNVEKHPDAGLQQAFVRANIASALLDTSWYQAERRLAAAVREFGPKLAEESKASLWRLANTARASHFVRVSGSWNPQLLEVLGDLDDAIALGDTIALRPIVHYIDQNVRDANTLTRAGSTLIAHSLYLTEASRLLGRAIDLNPKNVPALRARARAMSLLGYSDSARALLSRSLQFDSTSPEALGIRQSLGYGQ